MSRPRFHPRSPNSALAVRSSLPNATTLIGWHLGKSDCLLVDKYQNGVLAFDK